MDTSKQVGFLFSDEIAGTTIEWLQEPLWTVALLTGLLLKEIYVKLAMSRVQQTLSRAKNASTGQNQSNQPPAPSVLPNRAPPRHHRRRHRRSRRRHRRSYRRHRRSRRRRRVGHRVRRGPGPLLQRSARFRKAHRGALRGVRREARPLRGVGTALGRQCLGGGSICNGSFEDETPAATF